MSAQATRVCVAYSGGVDSAVLLHALASARTTHTSLALSAIHVHHGLSVNADTWAQHCATTCAALDVPLRIVRVSVTGQSDIGIEAAARDARYAALRAHAHRNDPATETIALAHHARDQAETLLLQLLRGAGPAGLAAMPESSSPFARPLLDVSKAAVDAYAGTHRISHITDESNNDARFARNRLRLDVWPDLTRAFASAERTLARASRWQHEADELAVALAEIDLAACSKGALLIASTWRALAPSRRRNALRHWLAQRGISAPSAERLLEWERQLLTDNTTQNLVLSHRSFAGSIRLYRDRIQHVSPAITHGSQQHAGVAWNGESELRWAEGCLHFDDSFETKCDSAFSEVRPRSNGEQWYVRLRRAGDSIILSPNSGSVSLKNVFQKYSVPPWLRDRWPILVCNREVVALPGLVVASAFHPSTTGPCIRIRWQPPDTTQP